MSETNDKKALKSGLWYIIANFATKGISFITMPIFVRIMTTDEIGQFVNMTTWIALLTPVVTLSLDSSVAVAKFEFKEKINEYIRSILILGSLATLILYVLCVFIDSPIRNILKLDYLQLHIMFLYLLFMPALQMIQIKSRLDYKYKLSTVLSLISAGVCTVISLIVVIMSDDKLQGRILGLYGPSILLNICIYIYFFSESFKIKTEYWKYGLKISIPLIFHALAGSLLSSFDKVMINSMVGSSETALYSVAYTCATVIDLLWYSLNQAWAPWAYEQMEKKDGEKLKKVSKIYLILFAVVDICFMLIAPEILWLIGGESYLTALPVIPPVMCGFVFQLVYSLYVNIETREKKTVYVAIGTITAALVNIGLNAIFIPLLGYIAAAYTTLAGYIVLFFMHYIFVNKIGKAYWYDSKFIIIYLSVFAVFPFLITATYHMNIIRYAFIAVIFLIFIVNLIKHRQKLIEAVRKKSFDDIITVVFRILLYKKGYE